MCTKCISDFGYRWRKARSILRPLQHKRMGENENAPLFDNRHYKHFQRPNNKYTLHTEPENVTRDPSLCPWGQLRLQMESNSFSLTTSDRCMLERWKHLRWVRLDDTDRLICNMSFSGHVMTLTWGQIFQLTLQGQVIVHSTCLYQRSTMLVKSMSWLSWVKKKLPKKNLRTWEPF